MVIFKHRLYLIIMALLLELAGTGRCLANADDPSILIDTAEYSLTVLSANNRPLAHFNNIAVGRGGVSESHLAGDATTPLGTFHVSWINQQSRFKIFFGLDYPRLSDGERALALGIIEPTDYDAILKAHQHGHLPPQDTALGGHIGIHGIGSGDPAIQQLANWTKGCVALTNEDAVTLSKWIRIGTKVVIR